ncbi:MAG TPA: amidase family protein, partial [Thermoanaerobaculia bacterium]|nr:amidase family protein [Thermoanaerobaculia bacterium]
AEAPVGDYLARIEEGLAGRRIGVLREIEPSRLGGDVARDWAASLDRLTRLGAELVEVSVPSVDAAIAVYYVIATSEASSNLARFDGVRYGRRAPAADNLADLYFESRGEGFGPEVKRRIMLGTFALSSGYYEAYYGRARGVLERLRHELDAAFAQADLLVTPTTPSAAFRLGEKVDDPLAMYLSDVFTTPANLAGVTATAVPSGAGADGLPLSLQILGPRFGEAEVFRAARAFERATGWTVAPAFRERRGAEAAAV